ncbi:MAG TPA: long-chain fatty acid--CoA ligase [Polyangiaceae bacterium]|nr:long-chain fatty acid--CoA ligase [Polyangiaceae bacterium]
MAISEWTRKCNEQRNTETETLADVLAVGMALRPDSPAIFFEDRTSTFRELDRAANRIASALVAVGVSPGDRVAIHVDNRPEFVEVYQGVMRAGAVLVPTNVLYTGEEMEHILRDSGAKVIFVRSDLAGKIEALRPSLPDLGHVVDVVGKSGPGATDLEAFQAKGSGERPEIPIRKDALAFIQYTSGTTGKPKGAMVSHANVLAVIDNMMGLPGTGYAEPDDVLLLVLPLFHAYALNLALNRAFLGAMPFVLVNRFDATKVTALIAEHKVTLFYGAPPMYFAFVNTPGLEKYDVSSLKLAFSGAAPLPVVILERFERWTGVKISEGYGLSETAPTLCSNAAGPVNKPGTVGPAIPGVTIRLVDDQDRDVLPGEVGEIVAKGPNVFRGYWKREAETAEAMRGGWFHTGDLARMDADGYYTIVDRKKDMVLVSGYNVYPIEVENVLLRHPKILDAAVIGVPDEYQGESVKAVLVLRPGQSLETKEVQDYCREHLAAYKVPRHVEIRTELPKSATGKVLKRELRAK